MTSQQHDADPRLDKVLESLFAEASPRPQPSQQHEAAVRTIVYEEWQLQSRLRARRKNFFFMAAAAAAAIAFAAILVPRYLAGPDTPQLAIIDKQFGTISLAGAGPLGAPDDAVTAVLAGQILQTGENSGMALRWNNGGSLRLDQHTRVALTSAREIYLHAGRVYFDSTSPTRSKVGTAADGMEVMSIRTDWGLVIPLGTRYVVNTRNNEVVVSVRAGEVALQQPDAMLSAQAGYQLTVLQTGEDQLRPITIYGEEWTWVERTSPAFDTEGRSIFEFLEWVCRESGRSLSFSTDEAESAARSSAIAGFDRVELQPSQALRVVMLTSGLSWRQDNGVIYVSE